MPVEEVLVVDQGVSVTEVDDLFVGRALGGQTTQPRPMCIKVFPYYVRTTLTAFRNLLKQDTLNSQTNKDR